MQPSSPGASLLEELPFSLVEEICAHLISNPGRTGRRSLAALASASKHLRSVCAGHQFHTIQLHFEDQSGIPEAVGKWREILTEDRRLHVRRLRIVELDLEDELDEYYPKQWPPDHRGEDNMWIDDLDDEVWPLDKDDEFWTRPEPITFNSDEPVLNLTQKAQTQILWAPAVEFVSGLRNLRDVDYQCRVQIPGTLLAALNEREGGPVRLHMDGFNLRSLHQHASDLHDIDEDEFALATSPCLYSIRLGAAFLSVNTPSEHCTDGSGRVCFNQDALTEMIRGKAPNLKSVSVTYGISCGFAEEDATWRGFFPGEPKSPIVGKGSLETLALGYHIDTCPKMIWDWAAVTNLAELRSLHLDTDEVDANNLRPLIEIAESGGLRSLRSLTLWTRSCWVDPYDSTAGMDHGDVGIAQLLKALPPLTSMQLKGSLSDLAFGAVLSHHGASLRRLRLIPGRPHYWERPEPFVLSHQRVAALVAACPDIRDLELLVPRSEGDKDEARIYHALAELPQLDRLSLLLDCSDIGAAKDDPDNVLVGTGHDDVEADIAESSAEQSGPESDSGADFEIPHEPKSRLFINLTICRSLATDIFDTLGKHRSPRLIRLIPDGMGNFGTEFRAWSVMDITNVLCRAWVRERDDAGGPCRITRVDCKGKESSMRSPLAWPYYGTLNTIWPGMGSTWPKEAENMSGYPLWREGEPEGLRELPRWNPETGEPMWDGWKA